MTADGKRFRSGGGVLWNIIKVREPNAYKEIMKKAREFEVFDCPLLFTA
jgi:phosphorylated adapter RNA export protein